MHQVIKIKNVRDPYTKEICECDVAVTEEIKQALNVVEMLAKKQLKDFGFEVNSGYLSSISKGI